MRPRIFFSLVVFMGFSALALAQAKTDNDPAELKKFQGKWMMVSGKMDGKPVAPEQIGKSTLTWSGDDTTIVTPHQASDPIKAKSTIKAAKGGVGIVEFTRVNGPEAGKKTVAIYEFRGPDEYVFVFAPGGKELPKELDSKAGTGVTMHHWKRVKS